MAVLAKSVIDRKTKQLEQYYQELKVILEGSPVDKDVARYLVHGPEEVRNITNISLDRLADCLGHIKVTIESLGRLKADVITPSQNPRYFDEDHRPF